MAVTSHPGRNPVLVLRDATTRAVVESSDLSRFVVGLVLVGLVLVAHVVWGQAVPVTVLVPAVIGAALVLPLAYLKIAYAVLIVAVGVLFAFGPDRPYGLSGAAVVVSMALMFLLASSRGRHGVSVFAGDRMLVELRASMHAAGEMPVLPEGWGAERSFAPAHEQAFSGDFDVAYLDEDGRHLEFVLVDVSGQGQRAATRAVGLSGALAGLIGSTPADELLCAGNAFLGRAHWDEGFATAIHVCVDLRTGIYSVAAAGHPPAVQYDAGRGRWVEIVGGLGPALGLLPHPEYPRVEGRLHPGDALLVYTDGVVETPDTDLSVGIDWMLGRAEATALGGWAGLAETLVSNGRAGDGDDSGAVIIWRE